MARLIINSYAHIFDPAMTAMKRIREEVFGMTQSAFAETINVTQGTISRWENGMEPTREQLSRVRAAARRLGKLWNDTWFFEPSDERKAS